MRHASALALVLAAVVLADANATGGGLVFDARVLVAENPTVGVWSGDNVWFALTHDYWQPMATDGLYRPLTVLSFMVDRAVLGHGDRAFGYVVENVALHAGCAALVYALVWHLVRRRWPATVAALLFALHPIATEAVTNVVGRADLLAVTGVLAGTLCWAKGRGRWGGGAWRGRSGLVVASVLAFFSKESGLVLVAALALYDASRTRPRGAGCARAPRRRRGARSVPGRALVRRSGSGSREDRRRSTTRWWRRRSSPPG
jgi:hypothetical protein